MPRKSSVTGVTAGVTISRNPLISLVTILAKNAPCRNRKNPMKSIGGGGACYGCVTPVTSVTAGVTISRNLMTGKGKKCDGKCDDTVTRTVL